MSEVVWLGILFVLFVLALALCALADALGIPYTSGGTSE